MCDPHLSFWGLLLDVCGPCLSWGLLLTLLISCSRFFTLTMPPSCWCGFREIRETAPARRWHAGSVGHVESFLIVTHGTTLNVHKSWYRLRRVVLCLTGLNHCSVPVGSKKVTGEHLDVSGSRVATISSRNMLCYPGNYWSRTHLLGRLLLAVEYLFTVDIVPIGPR